MPEENWYLLLDLEFDPNPVKDDEIIKERIKEKKLFWGKQAINSTNSNKYSRYIELIPEITKDMTGDENIRDELIKDAIAQCKPIDELIKTLTKSSPEISQDVINNIASKRGFDANLIKKRAEALGRKITESKSSDYQSVYNKYYKTKPKGYDKVKQDKEHLDTFKASDIYEFLSVQENGTLNKAIVQKADCDELRKLAKDKEKEFIKTDTKSSDGNRLIQKSYEYFKNDDTKKEYDACLEYIRLRTILDETTFYEESGLSEETYESFINRLTSIFKDYKKSEKVLFAFCKVKNISVPSSGKETSQVNNNIKVCRCGCFNDVSDGRKKCQSCGLDLLIKCPKCGVLNENIINVCKCGFKLDNIDRAVALCELADYALIKMDFNVAEAHLNDAEKYWPGNEIAGEIRTRLDTLQKRVGSAVDDMRTACQDKRYFEAKRQLESVKTYAPNYSEPSLEEEISNALSTAEKYRELAQSSKNEAEVVDACSKAYEACQDYPRIKEIISRYPPQTPTNLKISADPAAQVNILSWTKSTTSGLLFYSVVRKEGAVPISIKDGTLIGRVSMCTITDNMVVPGSQYYYAVFAERAGIFSESLVSTAPVTNLFEISNVKAAAGDGLIQLTWNPIADNAVVEIEQTDAAGKTTKLACNSRSNFVAKELTNDKEYTFRLFLTYSIGAKKTSTDGVFINATPTRPPLPIEKLVVKPGQGDEFSIEWDNPDGGEVQFFSTSKKPDWIYGDLVSVSELESSTRQLVVKKTSSNAGTFKYEGEELIYVLAVVVKSGSAVIGTIARASKGGAVKIKNISLVNGKIMINLDLPKNCTGFVVLYRNDQFPDDLSDNKASRKHYPLKQYQQDGALLIDSNEPLNYYFSVFAEFRRDGECDYSTGTDYLFSNVGKSVIYFSVSANKKLFGGGTVTITFSGENNKFSLPDIEVVSEQGRRPIFKEKCKTFCQISAQDVVGTLSVNVPIEKGIPRDTYIQPFLRDSSLKDKYKFQLKPGSEQKIS